MQRVRQGLLKLEKRPTQKQTGTLVDPKKIPGISQEIAADLKKFPLGGGQRSSNWVPPTRAL